MTPIYIALDFPNWYQTKAFLDRHHLHGCPVKVGMELFYSEGPAIIEKLKADGHPIFLDLKLHDIPTTVKKAMRSVADLDVDLVNVHALGGREMMHAAREGLVQGSPPGQHTVMVAVTILTSMTNDVFREDLSMSGGISEQVLKLAVTARDSGLDGVVCSAHEADLIKNACGHSFLTVTPGIRLQPNVFHDQRRVATPGDARRNNADILVIGRSITESKEPLKAYHQAKKEWEDAAI